MTIHRVSQKEEAYTNLRKKTGEQSQKNEKDKVKTELKERLRKSETPKMFSSEKESNLSIAYQYYIEKDELYSREQELRRLERRLQHLNILYESGEVGDEVLYEMSRIRERIETLKRDLKIHPER